MASSTLVKGFPGEALPSQRMFWSLDIDPPKAERFICNLELGICSFSLYVVL